jgi:hypothetical protein
LFYLDFFVLDLQGRSKSLTHIDTLDPSTEVRDQEHPLLGASNSSGGDGAANIGGKGHAGMRHKLSGNGGGDVLAAGIAASSAVNCHHPPKNSFQSHDMHHLRGFHAAIQATAGSPPDSGSGNAHQPHQAPGQTSAVGEATSPTGGGGTAVTAIKQRNRRTKLASSMKVCRPYQYLFALNTVQFQSLYFKKEI